MNTWSDALHLTLMTRVGLFLQQQQQIQQRLKQDQDLFSEVATTCMPPANNQDQCLSKLCIYSRIYGTPIIYEQYNIGVYDFKR